MLKPLTIHLLKPAKGETVCYQGNLLFRRGHHLLVHARWERERRDLGYVVFEQGDHFFEHYFLDEYFNIFELRTAEGALKGWYCNITRPARLDSSALYSEDLELDLFVSPDRQRILTLDEDEFEARGLDEASRSAALAALHTLRVKAQAGDPPFNGSDDNLSLAR